MDSLIKKDSLKEIKIEEIKEDVSLGDILYQHIDFIKSSGINRIIIILDNIHMKGKYTIPTDLGLLTPIKICEGGVLRFHLVSCKSRKVNYIKLFKRWDKSISFKFKDCMKLCSICITEYNTGDELIRLSCDHIFHSTCISKLKDSTLEKGDGSSQTSCTCPLCRTPI